MLHNGIIQGNSPLSPIQFQCNHIDDQLKQARCCDCVHFEERKRGANCYMGPDCILRVDKPKICSMQERGKRGRPPVKYAKKQCPVCRMWFSKDPNTERKVWEKRKCCSRRCTNIYRSRKNEDRNKEIYRLSQTMKHKDIAKKFGLSRQQTTQIINRVKREIK
jgi:hypothetical protein